MIEARELKVDLNMVCLIKGLSLKLCGMWPKVLSLVEPVLVVFHWVLLVLKQELSRTLIPADPELIQIVLKH
ncbi:AIF_collapsed_G0031700.mRNA.1.CDS.1 [Saccharomyces cerevisiae]|nr:AIF_collapsed_G0031700.mRNA.1.CDS.1 [Saccharomyces cerevisiae]